MATPLLQRLSDYLVHWALLQPDSEAAVLGGVRWTWSDLRDQVDSASAVLQRANVRDGDRVAVLGHPGPEFLAIFLAVLRLGAIFQGLNPKYTARELEHVLTTDGKPALMFDTLKPISPSERNASRVVQQLCKVIDWPSPQLQPAATSEAYPPSQVSSPILSSPDLAPAILVYTSGSTGTPKGALLPHSGLSLCSTVQANQFDLIPGTRVLCNLPINHVGGLVDTTGMAIACGGTLVFQERFDAVEALTLIKRERVNFWLAVPAMFALAESTPEFDDTDLTSLRHIVWSGGAMSMRLALRLRSKCASVANAYGMTETVGNVTFTSRDSDLAACCETVGIPVEPYEVIVARSDGSECDPGEPGEIFVRGDFLMLGYLNYPEATSMALDPNGWLHTGDIAVRRRTGEIALVGRKSDMFKSGGYNVYPREIELALEEHPDVDMAAVVGFPDEIYGEVGHAFVQSPTTDLDVEALKAFTRTRLANYKLPKEITVVAKLPRLDIGKVDKAALRNWRARMGR